LEGNSLLYLGIKYSVFDKVLPSTGLENGFWEAVWHAMAGNVLLTPESEDVSIHAVAFAGWAGLLVTAINLIPVGQLDGGHVLFGLLGRRAQLAIWPFVAALVGLSRLYSGWFLLILLMLLARRNAPVLDEITELDPTRRWLGVLMLVIFVLIFVPVPLQVIPLP
jgi:Zn-dependent protease